MEIYNLDISYFMDELVDKMVYEHESIFGNKVGKHYIAGLTRPDLYIESIEYGTEYIHMTIGTASASLVHVSLRRNEIVSVDCAR